MRGTAQAQSHRLDVRPHQMATGTTNPAAGEYPLDSVSEVLISVSKQCEGAHRCPLFVMLPGGGISARQMTDWLRPVTDKYGMILLATTGYSVNTMNAALKETLRRFAIDPDKIAIVGRCASGGAGTRFGIENLDVFNRIASVSGDIPVDGVDPNNKTAEFLIDESFLANEGDFPPAKTLRQGGHPVKVAFALRGHEHQAEDYDFVGHWLQESWAKPNPADRTQPVVIADPLPELTSDILTKMTNFWTSFGQEPDSIRAPARRATLHEVIVPVGTERPSVWMTNMPVLAAKYPSVAADLRKAGLTAEQHDAYRVALISVQATKVAGDEAGTVDASSVLAKNLEFLNAHLDEFKTLRAAGIAHPDQVQQVQASATITHPRLAEEMGAMGIWRTP